MNSQIADLHPELISIDFEKLPYNIYFSFYALNCRLTFDDGSLSDKLMGLLPPFHNLSESPECAEHFCLITKGSQKNRGFYRNGERILEFYKLDETVFEAIESKIQLSMAVAMPPEMFFLHAGAVAYKDFGIIIPGRSFSGKTTLTEEFLKNGAKYYSDDCAVIDGAGRLYAYSKTLSIRNSSLQGEIYSVEDVGGVSGRQPIPVRMIIFAEYKKRNKMRLEKIGQGEAVLKLAKNLFYPASMTLYPSETLQALARLAGGAIIFSGKRGEAREVLETVLQEFDFIKSNN